MRVHFYVLTAAICALSLFTAFADTISPPRAAIQLAYDQMNAAFKDNRMDRMADLLAPGYTETDPKGHVSNRSAVLKRLQGLRNQTTSETTRTTITNITPGADGALVSMQQHMAGTGIKKVLFVTLHGTFTNDLVVQDEWVRTPSGWLLQTRRESVNDTETHAG